MEFRILGPLEVVADGKALDLGGPKQRALLAIFLLEGNRVVSSDRLIAALWDETPPETALKALQVYVSKLRKLLGKERLETRAPGYLLRLGPDELDLARFQRLQQEEKPEEALSLWRGPPLAEFAYERFAQAEIERLEEVRLACLEERIDHDLARGRHAELVGELEALVREYPVRERLRGQLMFALYRSGRQAEALDAYQAVRHALVQELGIEPARALRDLHQAVLNQDSSLDFVATTEEADEAAERSRSSFVGRERELAELTAALEEALAGHGRLVLLAGEPGIGKSRLADEVANRAKKRGARVVVGRCWEAGGAPAYWPWVQAARGYIGGTEPEALRTQLGAGAVDVAHILPELREILPAVPAAPSLEPEAARFRLFDSMTTFLKNAAAARPLVIVLDDLHAADEPTLLLLQFITRELGDGRLLLVAAYRDVDPTLTDPLLTALTELAREPVTRTVPLGGLDEVNVARFIEFASGEAPAEKLVATVHEETEGNPLFVGEIVRLLLTEGRLDASAAGEFALPQSVKDVIGRRLRHLSTDCNRILTLASVLGREFDLRVLARVAAVDGDTLLELLDEAIAARVVSERPVTPGRLRFAHALIRDTVYEALTSMRRVQLHRHVGEALENLHADDREPYLAELAYHFFEAAPGGGADKAVTYARRAGDRAVTLLAFEEAARLYGMALELTEDRGARCDLLLALGEAQARAGDTPAAKATFQECADLAESQGLSEQLARAALGYGGRFIWQVSRDDAELAPLLEKALAALGDEDSILRVRLLGRLASGPLRDSSVDAERRWSLAVQALQMARRIGEPSTLAYALNSYIASHHSPDFTPAQADIAKEQIQVALQAGDLERAVDGYDSHFLASVELADLSSAYADLDAMAALADELRQPAQRWLVAVYRALSALLEGRLEEAEQLIIGTRSLGERAQDWDATVVYGLQLYLLRREQGRVSEIEELVRRATADNPTYPIWRCVLASMLAELGLAGEARAELDELAADEFGRLPFDEEWEVSLCLLAETAARLRDGARAATLYECLLPYADRVAISYPEISLGPVARFLGILAAATARWDDAERHFRHSLELSARIGARPSLAHTQTDCAQMLLDRDGRSRSDEVVILLDQALATYGELGMGSHALRAASLRERAAGGSRVDR